MNTGLMNEYNLIDLINQHVDAGYSNFVFKGGNSVYAKYFDIVKAIKFEATTTRRDDVFCKADVLLIGKTGSSYPISVKIHDTSITWESADSTFRDALYDFSNCYGKPILPHGKRIIIPLEGDFGEFVFGDDIVDNGGCICIQRFTSDNFIKYSKDTVVIKTNRVFNNIFDVDDDEYYKPCLTIRSSPNRNKLDDVICGYRAEVSPIGDSYHMIDIVDQIKFK